ncbi:MAG: hypothetical protein IKN87_03495, partial [Bacilli bacterium]|nr:hypothetical protein [Bacilli bacterium]
MSKRGIFKFGLYDIPANCVLQHQDIFGNTTVLSPGVKTVFGYVRKRYMDVVNRNFDNIIVRNEYNQDLIFDFSLSYKIAGGLKNDDEDSKLYQKSVDKYASEEKETAAEDWLKIHQEEISKNSHFTHVAEQLNYSDKKNWSEHHPIREYLKYEDEIEDEIFNEERNIQSEPGILRNTIQNAVRDIFVNSDYYDLTNISSNDEKVKKLYKNLKRDFFKMGLQLEDLNLKNIRMNNNYIEHSINSNISLNEKILKKEKKVVDTGFEYAELPPISIYREYPNGEPSGEVNFEHISRKEFIVMNKKGDKIIPLDDIQDEDVKKDAFDETIKDIFGDKTKDNNNNNNDCDNCPVIKENEELREANKKLEEDNNAMADDNYDLTLINKKLNEQVEDTLSDNTRILVDSDIIENNNLALVKENEKYVNENHELSVENDKLNTKVLELKRQLKNYSIKNVKLLVEQDEMENTNLVLANKVEELETANEATTKEKEELNNQLNEALSKNAQLLVEQDEKDNINNELANKVEELTATNEATTKEKEELNNQLNEALSKKTQLLVEQDEMDNNNYALANKVEELETENEVIIKEKEILNNQLGEALSKNAKILVEKEEIENINHELMEEIKKKETENELLRTGNVFITAQLNQTFTIHKQKTATEVDNLYLENEVNKLSELVKNQDEVIYDLSIANYEMENANIEKDKTIASLNSKNTDLSMELADKAELDKRVVATEMD